MSALFHSLSWNIGKVGDPGVGFARFLFFLCTTLHSFLADIEDANVAVN